MSLFKKIATDLFQKGIDQNEIVFTQTTPTKKINVDHIGSAEELEERYVEVENFQKKKRWGVRNWKQYKDEF